jgi:hypothetical protein
VAEPNPHLQVYLDALVPAITRLPPGGTMLVPGGLVRIVSQRKAAETETIQEQLVRLQAAAAAEEKEERALSMMERVQEMASSVVSTVSGSLAATREFVGKERKRALDAAGVGHTELDCAPLLFVLHRVSHDSFSLAVVNTGLGAEYNPMSPDRHHGGGLLRCMSLVLRDVPLLRAANPMWWFLATRSLAFPSASHAASLLYERLLPFLNGRPLLSNGVNPGVPIPRGGDPSRVQLVLEALRNVLAFVSAPRLLKGTVEFGLRNV